MTNHPPYAIEVKQLSKSFGGNIAVNQLSIQINHGEVYGFLGPNGSGKTTTIRLICGLLKANGGGGNALGYDIAKSQAQLKTLIGYMPQRFSYYDDLTVKENLLFVAKIYGIAKENERVDELLAQFDLTPKQHQFANALSGGWRQRLSLAASILHQPKILLLDEPTAGVDPESRRYFWDLIHSLAAEGTTILVSTHYMDEAERCNRLAFLLSGNLVMQGTQKQIIQQANLTSYVITGPNTYTTAKKIEQQYPKLQVMIFGNSVHISTPQATLDENIVALINQQSHLTLEPMPTTVEHVFIHLVRQYQQTRTS